MKRLSFRVSSGLVILALIIATLQILFDVPVAPFLVPSGAGSAAGAELTASYPSLIVQRGIPVEFTLSAVSKNIDECNEWILIPDYGIKQKLIEGDNVLRFTPDESGVFQIVCGMGRMKSTVTVVESLGFNTQISDAPSSSAVLTSSVPEDTTTPQISSPPVTSALPESSSLPETAGPQSETSASKPEESTAPVYVKPDDDRSLGGWLEGELQPSAGAEGVKEIRTWTGWIFDRDCVGISPVKHTKACNLMGSCYDSGLGIFEYVPGKAFDSYTAVETFLCFDGASKELAVAFLKALPVDWKNNITVTVTGYAVNNIPAAADEALVPETDLSRVDHYLNGIHITSIEAAYIDGLSTNPLPEPNVVFSQP